MAATDFPASPTNGQVFTSGDHTWVYSTAIAAWDLQTQTLVGPTGPTGATGATGATGPTGATGATGFGVAMPMVSTYYYKTPSGATTVQPAGNRTFYLPIFIAESTTFDRIALRTGATFSGTATVRLGIYNSSAGLPTTVSLDAGTVSATAASTNYTITVSHTLGAGLYFLAHNTQTAASPNQYVSATNGYLQNTTGTTPSGISTAWFEDVTVTSGFPTAATTLSVITNAPDVWIRKA